MTTSVPRKSQLLSIQNLHQLHVILHTSNDKKERETNSPSKHRLNKQNKRTHFPSFVKKYLLLHTDLRRGARVAEEARLESV